MTALACLLLGGIGIALMAIGLLLWRFSRVDVEPFR